VSGQQLSARRVACCIVIALRAFIQRDWIAASRCHVVRALLGTPRACPELRRKCRHRWLRNDVLCSVVFHVLTLHLSPSSPVPVPLA
jgi:hypothetical protein